MRVLCVAEKPSQAKAIVQILGQGRQTRREGTSQYNKNYDFEYRISGTFVPATMTSVSGHIKGMDFPQTMKSWYSCNPIELFTADVIKCVDENGKRVAQNIEREARTASHLYIWTDCDREGEGIGGEIAELCIASNPRIVVKRAHFSSVLPQEIHSAMQNPRDLDMRQVDAVEARTELDLRIGSALTRYQTLRLRSRFAALSEKLISYGPCQFPTLGFVVDQFLRVEGFVPEPFWFIFMDHVKEDGHASFLWKRSKLFDQEVCFAFYAKCMDQPMARISSVRSRPKEKWRPLPLTTVELQKCCARYLRMAPDRIMAVAESLYNQGFISYPRTETDQFDPSMDLRGVVVKLAQYQPFSEYAEKLANGEFMWPRQGRNNDKAHPPIHPVAAANNLSGDDKKLYEFVTRRFLACCSENAKGQATEVEALIAGEQFSAKGLMIIARNYLDIYPYDRWSESTVPVYTQGDTFEPTTLEMRTGSTTAPKLLSFADLVDIMDKNGIGTDATHADHIKKIIDREYVFKSREETLTPSTLGIGLVEGYDAIGLELSLSKPYLRRETERELRLICQGVKTKESVVSESIRLYKAVYEKSTEDIAKLEDALGRCLQEAPVADASAAWAPRAGSSSGARVCACSNCSGCGGGSQNCGGSLALRSRANGGWVVGCSLYPQCKHVVWIPDFVLEVSVSSDDCPSCISHSAGPAKLLDIRFKPGSVPASVPSVYKGCIRGCDELINEFFNVRAISTASAVQQPQPQPRRPAPKHQQQQQQHYQYQNGGFQGNGASMGPGAPALSRRSSPSSQNTLVQPSPTLSLHNNNHNGGGNPDTATLSSNPTCRCGTPSIHRVTIADGPNKGRPFYACPKTREAQCGFFEWADQQQPSTSTSSYQQQQMPLYGHQPLPSVYSSAEEDTPITKPKCKCGLYAALKTKQTGGPNQGREYYMCTRAFNGCGFVCWANETDAYVARAGFSANGNSSPAPSSSSAIATSTCYKCGQTGHWARECPNGSGQGFGNGGGADSFLSYPPERPAPSGPARRGRSRGGGRSGGRSKATRGGRGRGGKGRGGRSVTRAVGRGGASSGGTSFIDTMSGGFDYWD
ncbi:DNA topoisomerase 3-alpha [Coemansia sp. RSA 1843]|nr:DNA topoisomerase 3-alpha [Coemansia sp. RSA 1843]